MKISRPKLKTFRNKMAVRRHIEKRQ